MAQQSLEAALGARDVAAFVTAAVALCHDDAKQLEAFLRQALAKVEAGATSQAAVGEPVGTAEEEKAPLYRLDDVQAHTPRGRVALRFYEKGMALEAKAPANSVAFSYDAVKHVLRVAKPNPYRRNDMAGADYFVLVLDPAPQNGRGKAVPSVLLQADRKGTWQTALATAGSPPVKAEEQRPVEVTGSPPDVLATLLGLFCVSPLHSPDASVFESCQTGAPYVTCYAGVQTGDLWPLPTGLLFVKPPRFVPEADIVGLACGRGGSGGSTRYVDLEVTLDAGQDAAGSDLTSSMEFTNIDRKELPSLEAYVQWLTRKRSQDNARHDGEDAKPAAAEKDASGALSQSPLGERKRPEAERRRPARATALQAREATRRDLADLGDAASEEDADFEDQGGESEESSDDESDGVGSGGHVEEAPLRRPRAVAARAREATRQELQALGADLSDHEEDMDYESAEGGSSSGEDVLSEEEEDRDERGAGQIESGAQSEGEASTASESEEDAEDEKKLIRHAQPSGAVHPAPKRQRVEARRLKEEG